jgi:hypothetical protein
MKLFLMKLKEKKYYTAKKYLDLMKCFCNRNDINYGKQNVDIGILIWDNKVNI